MIIFHNLWDDRIVFLVRIEEDKNELPSWDEIDQMKHDDEFLLYMIRDDEDTEMNNLDGI